jgi:ribonuclease HI
MKNSMSNIFNIYTDGGSRGNPGPAAISFIIYDYDNKKIQQKSEYIGNNTNNYAEYLAILKALINVKKYNPSEVNIYTDSNLAYNQINGFWKVKDSKLKDLILEIKKEILNYKNFRIFYIPREKNKEADSLVNKELNLNEFS